MMHISVMVATCRPRGFQLPLQALLAQTRLPNEVIWVADGVELEEAFGDAEAFAPAGRLPSRFVKPDVTPRLYGPSVALNVGLDVAQGDLLLVLADRSWVGPDWVKAHALYHEIGLPVCLVSGGKVLHEEDVGPVNEACSCPAVWMPFDRAASRFGQAAFPPTIGDLGTAQLVTYSSLSLSLRLMREIGGWDERFAGGHGSDDVYLALQAHARSGLPPLVTMDPRLISHRLKTAPGGTELGRELVRTSEDNLALLRKLVAEELHQPAWRAKR